MPASVTTVVIGKESSPEYKMGETRSAFFNGK